MINGSISINSFKIFFVILSNRLLELLVIIISGIVTITCENTYVPYNNINQEIMVNEYLFLF